MRKIASNMPLFVCLIVFTMSVGAIWILIESQGRVFAQGKDGEPFVAKRVFERVLTLQERQPIYMKGAAMTQIGVLEANQPVAVTGEDEAYYELRLGNMTAFVRKGQATVEKKKLLTVVDTERLAAVHALKKTWFTRMLTCRAALFWSWKKVTVIRSYGRKRIGISLQLESGRGYISSSLLQWMRVCRCLCIIRFCRAS